MDTSPQTAELSLACGETLTLRELTFRQLTEFEEGGYSFQSIAEGKKGDLARAIWMMAGGEDAMSWDDFLDKVTLQDFMRNRKIITEFMRDPLEQEEEKGGSGTG